MDNKQPASASLVQIELNEDSRIGFMSFMKVNDSPKPTPNADIMAALVEQKDRFELGFRIRLYTDAKSHDSDDPKLWQHRYIMKDTGITRASVALLYHRLLMDWGAVWGYSEVDTTEFDWCDMHEFAKRIQSSNKEYVHVKTAKLKDDDDEPEYPNMV